MKGFVIRNGDFVFDHGGFQMVEGAAKVEQDLGLAVREAYGTDRFHPQWGSIMNTYIGFSIDDQMPHLLEAEMRRVVQNYVAIQQLQLQQDATAGRKSRYGTNEIIVRVDHVSIVQQYDGMHLQALISTLGHQEITIATSAGE